MQHAGLGGGQLVHADAVRQQPVDDKGYGWNIEKIRDLYDG